MVEEGGGDGEDGGVRAVVADEVCEGGAEDGEHGLG